MVSTQPVKVEMMCVPCGFLGKGQGCGKPPGRLRGGGDGVGVLGGTGHRGAGERRGGLC